jgi:hypothetical protein
MIKHALSKSFCNNRLMQNFKRINKFYILAESDWKGNKNKEIFNLISLYENFYKLQGKLIFSNGLDQNLNSERFSVSEKTTANLEKEHYFLQYLIQIFKENNFIEEKQENLENSNEYQKNYYLDFKKFLPEIEKENNLIINKKFEKIRWPSDIVNYHEGLLKKETSVKICFKIINELQSHSRIEEDVLVDFEKAELLFGVTFLVMVDDENNKIIHKLNLNNFLKTKACDSHHQFILPTTVFAINPINDEKIPIAIVNKTHCMVDNFHIKAGIPGHDHYDYKLAQDLDIKIKKVVKPLDQMNDSVLPKETSQSIMQIKSQNAKKSQEDIKREILLTKINEGPLLLNSLNNSGFLINCKEFDFLYLDEARLLIVNNLLSKGKAHREENYFIKNLLIAQERNGCLKFDNAFIKSVKYLSYINSLYDKVLSIEDEILKILVPADLVISRSWENIFYSRIIHKVILNIIVKKNPLLLINDEDTVYLSKEQELEKNFLLPVPFVHILSVDEQKFQIYIEEKENYMNKIFASLEQVEISLINTLENSKKSQIFEIEKIRDEKIDINDKDSLISLLYKDFINIIDLISQHRIELNIESLKLIDKNLTRLLYSLPSFEEKKNVFFFIYLNFLLLTYPFNIERVEVYFKSFYHKVIKYDNQKSLLKQNLSDYSLEKMANTWNYFLDLFKNSIKMHIYINGIKEEDIVLDKLALKNENLLKDQIKEILKISGTIEIIESDFSKKIINIKLN